MNNKETTICALSIAFVGYSQVRLGFVGPVRAVTTNETDSIVVLMGNGRWTTAVGCWLQKVSCPAPRHFVNRTENLCRRAVQPSDHNVCYEDDMHLCLNGGEHCRLCIHVYAGKQLRTQNLICGRTFVFFLQIWQKQ